MMKVLDCSIKEEIEEILAIREELKDEDVEFEFNEPASESEIQEWEEKNKIMIPEQYKEWLRFSNGSRIEGHFVVFFGLENFIVNRESFDEPLVIIGSLIGDGEVLAFSLNDGQIIRMHDGRIKKYKSFQEILRHFIRIL